MSIGHLYVLFGEVSILVLCTFINWIVCFELTERDVKKTIPFTIALKIIECLGINLTKDVEDLCSENYDTEKLKKIQISGSTYHVHG